MQRSRFFGKAGRAAAALAVVTAACACSSDDSDAAETPSNATESAIHLTISVHLEEWPVHEPVAFQQYVARIREYATLAEKYGARLTWEVRPELVAAAEKFGDDLLSELQQRGHGVGVHADVGGKSVPGGSYSTAKMASDLAEMQSDLAKLGVTARHVSGICSQLDWVTAAIEGGYEAATGLEAYCLRSMGGSRVPEAYRGCASAESCRQAWPTDPEQRIHPWRAKNGQGWTQEDASGGLILFPSSGSLACAAEDAADPDKSHAASDCAAADDDVSATITRLEASFSHADGSRYAAYVIVWRYGTDIGNTMMEQLLKRITPYVTSGRVQWRTLPQMIDAFVASEE